MNESWDPAGPAVATRAVTKTYANGVRAVRGVDLDVPAGEIRAVVGENGAGKSTLMKLFYGLEQPTSGEILIGGRPRLLRGPAPAITLGVGMVHQNLMLVPSFTVAQNVVLGVEPGRRGLVDAKAAVEATARLAEEAGLAVDPLARIDEVSVGMRQRAEILKALHRRARILILDEPTAVLTPQETEDLFAAVRRLRDGGMTVLFISHKLREVREISDKVSVMRAGALVGTVATADTTQRSLAAMMVGREMSLDVARAPARRAGTTLRVRGLAYDAPTGQSLHGLDYDVAAGEIVGVAGIEGNGQTELAEILAGLRRPSAGTVRVGDTDTAGLDVAGHRRAGIGYVPEDRLHDGAALDESIADNLVVDRHDRPPLARRGVLRPAAVRAHAEQLIQDYAIRTPDPSVPVRALSGGNMQKVVVARELSAGPRLLIASQVTRGVDIGAMRFTIEWSFVIGGAVAGLAGAHLVQGVYGRLEPGLAGSLAFEGIVVALLARNNPLVVVVAGLFYSYLRAGGDIMEQQTDVGTEIVVVIQAVIVLLVTAQALPDLLKRRLARRQADTSREQAGAAHGKAGAR